jgi:3-oxoacyl-[acyl-carrier protein] reductase
MTINEPNQPQVLIHYNSTSHSVEEVLGKIRSLGVQAAAVQADAGDHNFGKILVAAALENFLTDTINIIVNNAGLGIARENTASVPLEDWDYLFHINIRGPFLLIQAALPYMKPGGRIVNVSTVMANLGSYKLIVYNASKAAVNSMTLSVSEELAPKGITVNTVSPGPIDLSPPGSKDLSVTMDQVKDDPIAWRIHANQHIKRKGTPQEVANAILFLVSPMSSYITGQVAYVDGGINLPL